MERWSVLHPALLSDFVTLEYTLVTSTTPNAWVRRQCPFASRLLEGDHNEVTAAVQSDSTEPSDTRYYSDIVALNETVQITLHYTSTY